MSPMFFVDLGHSQ